MSVINIKRAYEPIEKSDGFRILVDRLWPRGIQKEEAHFDVWLKEIAPSNELRKWFNHETDKWVVFRKNYKAELKDAAALDELKELIKKHEVVTLLYGAKDEQHNHAIVLKEFLENSIRLGL
jgi:uncharacterized protein YeaO (DUF488 family)